ncbi:MAG: Gfa-like protein [Alphaproteobacteria bacterium]|nr:Gfa-like protein [Alphaproteobacteria bacterium]
MTRPPIPAPPYDGGCLCGAVRWRLSARPLAVNACHCTDCKKLTGATNLLMLLATREAFSHAGDVERWRKRADSGRELDIARCRVCGTRLWHEPLSSPALVFVAAGTLDDPSWAVPTSHIWTHRASPGVTMQDDAIQVPGQPVERQALMDAFTAIYGDA